MTPLGYFSPGFSICIFFYNVYISSKKGESATGNIWKSRSPEWQVPSPMPVHNFDQEIKIVGEPYDYGLAGSVYVQIKSEE